LVDTGSGPWVNRAVDLLAGCRPRLVVVGASRDEVARLLRAGVSFVDNPGFAEGMGSSLRVGLLALATILFNEGKPVGPEIDAALVMLVDLPGVTPEVIRRVSAVAGTPAAARDVLARATYAGVAGHPVLLGRRHWAGVIESAVGDVGARDYFTAHPPTLVECGDIGSGEDIDTPEPVH
jgi:CTP:molybdopterin cytidylyltransferase MocA